MYWYEGSIAEAVNLSKQRNTIFVVFVEGDNDLSTEMATTIDNSDVVKRLGDKDNFLAIKLKSGSPSYTHFAQIYQFVPVPSLFFIGRNGTPLEVVCAGVEPTSLADRIDRILDQHQKEKPQSAKPSTSSSNIQQQTVELLRAEANVEGPLKEAQGKREAEPETSSGNKVQKTQHHLLSKSGKEYDVVCDGDVCVRVPAAAADGPTTSKGEDPQEPEKMAVEDNSEKISEIEKMERAKELIEARRREKAAKEKELEKQKELERRAVGQGVTDLKKWQADQELKQIQEERKREKMENNLARQRILEQIAQDRAERRARDLPPPAAPTAPSVPTAPTTTANTSGDYGTRARIQFKLPDGTSHSAHFDAEGTLADVQQYVADNLQLSSSRFSLWMAFPRRELRDGTETLRQLQLTPSGALLVLPTHTQQTVPHTSTMQGIIAFFTQILTTFLLQPSMQVFNWVRQRLFPAIDPPRQSDPPTNPPNVPGGSTGLRRRGNIHRLGEERGNDDDNNTWNGNSTQQM